jgi:hypothetical protein
VRLRFGNGRFAPGRAIRRWDGKVNVLDNLLPPDELPPPEPAARERFRVFVVEDRTVREQPIGRPLPFSEVDPTQG